MIRRVASVLIVGGSLVHGASAQMPMPRTPSPVYPSDQAPIPPPPPSTEPADPVRRDEQAAARRSIARLVPLPRQATLARPGGANFRPEPSSEQGRFANPGGVGRYSEYYTPNTLAMSAGGRPAARFGGGGTSRADQVAAFRAGQTRARNIQDNINAYGRPYGAYGFGFGAGVGYGYGLSGGRRLGYPY